MEKARGAPRHLSALAQRDAGAGSGRTGTGHRRRLADFAPVAGATRRRAAYVAGIAAASPTAPGGGDRPPARDHTACCTRIGSMRAAWPTSSAVRGGADSIVNAATEIAAGNMDLSSRTEQQAARSRRVNRPVDGRLTAPSSKTPTTRARPTSWRRLLPISRSRAARVAKVVHTMAEINDRPRKSSTSSAHRRHRFQTNILALNAAVSARAGRTGTRLCRGGERSGRTLAQRSPRRQGIKALIDDRSPRSAPARSSSAKRRDHGAHRHRRQIVTDIMGEISMASQDQKRHRHDQPRDRRMDTVTRRTRRWGGSGGRRRRPAGISRSAVATGRRVQAAAAPRLSTA